ncbi:LutC/YkgG family protein [Ferroacidibacillus organovorans]|uniref:LUD domain-containing protein n=1 Tax=Ferroacidibacillus organovorans TaxID=1765683 RepID=A0A101XNM3_9BACL|nr:LUD domain-containing protein [Ferroacidibacillus organovorans]KUO94582.1 hypothetical protein ATW55_04085 [Ferroacidibacillus organovorans]
MNERDFLTKIANRLGRDYATQTVPVRNAFMNTNGSAHVLESPHELTAQFKRELMTLGGEVRLVSDWSAVPTVIQEWLSMLNPRRVGVWGGDFIKEYALTDVLAPYELTVWGRECGVDAYQHVEVSITGCSYAIAETGTIVLMSTPERGRSVAVLPSVHIVLINQDQIRPRMGDVMKNLSAQRTALPSSVHFISGPSRSSDIENDQTIGIHGPAAVFALIVENH